MAYDTTTWENLPSTNTPINATNLNKIENGIKTNSDLIGGFNYSSSSTYLVGALVIYNNKIYKCTTAISTPEEWNSNHWVQTSVINQIVRRKLWQNPDTTQNFGVTEIPLGTTNYDFLEVYFKTSNNENYILEQKMPKIVSYGMFVTNALPQSGNNVMMTRRAAVLQSETVLKVYEGYVQVQGSGRSVANNYLIPHSIYGIGRE